MWRQRRHWCTKRTISGNGRIVSIFWYFFQIFLPSFFSLVLRWISFDDSVSFDYEYDDKNEVKLIEPYRLTFSSCVCVCVFSFTVGEDIEQSKERKLQWLHNTHGSHSHDALLFLFSFWKPNAITHTHTTHDIPISIRLSWKTQKIRKCFVSMIHNRIKTLFTVAHSMKKSYETMTYRRN